MLKSVFNELNELILTHNSSNDILANDCIKVSIENEVYGRIEEQEINIGELRPRREHRSKYKLWGNNWKWGKDKRQNGCQ